MTEKKALLILDLDDTLLKTDLLLEQSLVAIKKDFLNIFRLLLLLFASRMRVKEWLAQRVDIDPAGLPYRQDVIDYALQEKAKGSRVVLASASHDSIVRKIGDHLGFVDESFGSSYVNLKGEQKLQEIQKRFGKISFTYIGDSHSDFPIWDQSVNAGVVNPSSMMKRRMTSRLKRKSIPIFVFKDRLPLIPALLKALRVHQWIKNILVFIPLIAGHHFLSSSAWIHSVLAFFAFSFAASAGYVLNDLLDLEADRRHPTKSKRPFASGALSLRAGLLLVPLMVGGALSFALFLPPAFWAILGLYWIVTLLYSFKIKQVIMVDVVTLAALYTFRVFGGGLATAIPISHWLLAYSTFIFLGLALLKRFTEIKRMKDTSLSLHGRGYLVSDGIPIFCFGVICSTLSVLILTLYLNSQEVLRLYGKPEILWLATPIQLYWIGRLWLLAHRNEILDDPVLFTSRDKVTWITASLFLIVMFISL